MINDFYLNPSHPPILFLKAKEIIIIHLQTLLCQFALQIDFFRIWKQKDKMKYIISYSRKFYKSTLIVH